MIVAVIIFSILTVLAFNKKKIDKLSEPVDRSNVPVSVTVSKVSLKSMSVKSRYPGITEPYEEALLYSQSSGLISSLDVSLGKYVRKGQVLGVLDTRILQVNLKSASIAYESAKINLKKLSDDYIRAKDLYENNAGLEVNMIGAKSSYDRALNDVASALAQVNLIKEQILNNNIVAPVSGIISSHKVKEGEFVSPSTPIAGISNIEMVKVSVYVDSELAYRLALHETSKISCSLFPGEEFYGSIIYISPVADSNHNYKVDLLIQNKGSIHLKGGTDVEVLFGKFLKKDAVLMPKAALNMDSEEPYVYLAINGIARRKNVVTGLKMNGEVEVLSGLTVGDRVITSGQINLKDFSKIVITK
ncbi:efflux RND transporter periplasmic adaptor subunit [Elizabethkingia anophelis]|uniref:efflux RND transporter periplasmic adaptor subunit n=1 Tax=Elizabethkingia anophelis TaxID=1117645 RepID=UPI0021A3FAEF|nr:efflux RND transporter periplasmic adaptor subunit [Elizabethkingia anophelis]